MLGKIKERVKRLNTDCFGQRNPEQFSYKCDFFFFNLNGKCTVFFLFLLTLTIVSAKQR